MSERDWLMAVAALVTGLWIGFRALTSPIGGLRSNAVQWVARRWGPRSARVFVLLVALAFCSVAVGIAVVARRGP